MEMEAENSENSIDENELSLESSESEQSIDTQRLVEGEEKNDELKQLNFEQIYESIDEEEKFLYELEERRKKLEEDMERLELEIENEKVQFRQAIDSEIARKKEILSIGDSSSVGEDKSKVDLFNMADFQSKFEEYRNIIQESAETTPNNCEDDEELERLKSNLVSYRKTLDDSNKEKINKQKKKTAARLFQKHLEEVDIKCDEQLNKLVTIQKSIEKIGDGDADSNEQSA